MNEILKIPLHNTAIKSVKEVVFKSNIVHITSDFANPKLAKMLICSKTKFSHLCNNSQSTLEQQYVQCHKIPTTCKVSNQM